MSSSNSRSFPYNEKSILTTLFQYNIEVINLIATTTALFGIIIKAIAPVPVLFVHIMIVIIMSQVILSLIMGFSISSLKLLLITHFHLVFLQEPDQLGWQIFCLAMTLAAVPNIAITILLSAQGISEKKVLQLASGNLEKSQGLHSYYFAYMIFWALLSVLMMLVSICYIPYYVKRSQLNNTSIQAAEASAKYKSPNQKKMLFVFVLSLGIFIIRQVYVISYGEASIKLFPFYFGTFLPTVVLLVFTINADVCNYFYKVVTTKLTIKDMRSSRVAPQLA